MRRLEARRGSAGESHPLRPRRLHIRDQAEPSVRLASSWVGLAPSAAYSIPLLTAVPSEYQLQDGVRLAAQLAKGLLKADVAEPSLWAPTNGNPFKFIELALQQWLAKRESETIRAEFAINVVLTGSLDPYADERAPDLTCDEMYLLVEPDSAAYVLLGPTLARLEAVHPRLPATFFHLFTGALNRWIRTYDYRDAVERVEQLREWYESDPDEETIELPTVDRAIPACIRKRPLSRRAAAKLADQYGDGEVQFIMRAVLDLDRTAARATRPELSPDVQEKLMDSNPPLPSLLAVFQKHDAIEGCFDDESQGMLECTPEPNTIIPFHLTDAASVRSAFQTLEVICETLAGASRLIGHMMATNRGA
jgi:hypothetical protein